MKSLSVYLSEGDLGAAVEDLQQRVRSQPTNVSLRFELAEALLLSGAFERADTHFDLVSTQDHEFGLRVALVRQLIRAELARHEVFTQGRAPEVLGDIDPEIELGLKVLLLQRDGGDAAGLRQAADEASAPIVGQVDGQAINFVRDLDDRVADVLEVLTSVGKYYWVPFRRVRALELQPPQHPRDIIWRTANLEVEGGPEGVVYIPATYAAPPGSVSDSLKLGRETEWREVNGLTQGVGLRCLVLGEEATPFGAFELLTIDSGAPA